MTILYEYGMTQPILAETRPIVPLAKRISASTVWGYSYQIFAYPLEPNADTSTISEFANQRAESRAWHPPIKKTLPAIALVVIQ